MLSHITQRRRTTALGSLAAVTALVASLATGPAAAQGGDAPFHVVDGLVDTTDTVSLGLPQHASAETVTIFAPGDDDLKFNHGVVLMPFKDRLYAQWQSSALDEDTPDTIVTYSVSDDGRTWAEPTPLTAPRTDGYTSSGGWWTDGETLIAYLNVWPAELDPRGGYTEYVASTDGVTWTEPRRVTDKDGQPVEGIIEQDVKALPNGRILTAFHVQPGLFVKPYYTDDPLGVTGWTQGELENQPNTDAMSRELEPSWYVREDGSIVMVFRDQGNTFRKLGSVSEDNGETWTRSVLTNVPDSRTKQSAGNLPDGTAYLVGNPTGNNIRLPLSILLSTDGRKFDAGYTLRDSNDLQPRRYEGTFPRKPSYSYPKSVVWGDFLYSAYGTNKEDAQLTRVPVDSISLRDLPGTVDRPVAVGRQASLDVAWQAPSDTGDAPLTGYVVTVVSRSGATVEIEVGADAADTTVTGLRPGRYEVTVTAVNKYGFGEPSAASGWTTVRHGR